MKRKSGLGTLFVVLALVLAACGEDGAGEDVGETTPTTAAGEEGDAVACEAGETDGDLNFYNWTEYIDPELITAFESEFGVDVVEDFYDSNEALLAKLQSGAIYDLIVPSDYMVGIMIEEGILMELQKDAIPNISNLDPFFADPAYDPGGVHSAAYQWGTTGLGVNTDVVGEDFEPSWALVFDPEQVAEYPGGISLLNDPRETMGAALMYLGYSMNSTSEEELQEAADVIAAVKEHIAAFDSDTYPENLVNGEVAISHGFSGGFLTAFSEAEEGDAFAYVLPEEGATVWTDTMAVPANADHPCTAHAFINFLLDAENGATLTNWNYYASPNEAAEASIDAEVVEFYPPDDAFERLVVIENTGDFEINYTDYFAQAKS